MNALIRDQPLPGLKGAFPFRLGTTSYIIADTILANLYHLHRFIDDVELLLFESDAYANLPTPQECRVMAQIARDCQLSYTVHLPLDIQLGSADETVRIASLEKCFRVIERLEWLEPFAWILHLHGDRRGDPPTDDELRWQEQNHRSVAQLLQHGVASRHLCVESLDYDFAYVAALIKAHDLSVCLDIGHLLVNGRDVAVHLDTWLERARVFHLHGIDAQKEDHRDLGFFPEGLLEDIVERLHTRRAEDQRVLTLEVFNEEDFTRSLAVVGRRLARWLR